MNIITRDKARKLGLKRFFTGVECKHGHIGERRVNGGSCISCCVNLTRKLRQENPEIAKMYSDRYKDTARVSEKKYREENKDAISERKRKYYQENKEKINGRNREYREKNKDALRGKQKKYREENKAYIIKDGARYRRENKERELARSRKYNDENRDSVNQRNSEYKKRNPLSCFFRGSLKRIFTNWKGGRDKQESIHGYKLSDLTKHIESQFAEGMSWDNRSGWHIDHIKPISLFIKEGVTDPSVINALSNLQPLWAKDNASKGSKYEPIKSPS
jgi:hypothetical protein